MTFSSSPHRLCVSIGRETIDDALAAADGAAALADVLEIRLDWLALPAISPFVSTLRKPLLFTNRPQWEGGKFAGEEEQRIAPLIEAVEEKCSYIDLELLAPDASRARLLQSLQGSETRLILSWHNFEGTPSWEELVGRVALMQDGGADIGKVVTLAHSHRDVLKVLRLQEVAEQLDFPLIAFCMGRPGVISRVATVELGGYMTYCALNDEEATAPGQLSVQALRDIYNLMGPDMAIDGKTTLYGILGNPVSHSLSPAMHNAALAALGINAVYLPFPAPDIETAIIGVRALGIKGASVTIPHKETVMAHLDRIDPVAARIGAVNTLCLEEADGKLLLAGLNTDWLGATRALEEITPLAGRRVVLLGAGGSARAIGFGLLERGAEVCLCSRTESKGRALAEELDCPWLSLDAYDELAGEILVNATSVGMQPRSEATPVPGTILARFQVVMDIVYAPLRTRLLQEAETAGCATVGGVEMLLYQGVAQFEHWTGRKAPVEVMRQALHKAML